MNMADANAAAIHHKSPTVTGPPSVDNKQVPVNARKADAHDKAGIVLPRSSQARNGTNFTFKYSRKALRDAVVVSRPIDWNAKPRAVYRPNSTPARMVFVSFFF
jgi:hypothetical protein